MLLVHDDPLCGAHDGRLLAPPVSVQSGVEGILAQTSNPLLQIVMWADDSASADSYHSRAELVGTARSRTRA